MVSQHNLSSQAKTKFGNFFRNSCSLGFISATCGEPDEITSRGRIRHAGRSLATSVPF